MASQASSSSRALSGTPSVQGGSIQPAGGDEQGAAMPPVVMLADTELGPDQHDLTCASQQDSSAAAGAVSGGESTRQELLAAAAKQPLVRQVFVRHTGKNEGAKSFAASILKPELEAAGLQVFMDFSSLELGCRWPQDVVDAAANSMVFVALLSRQYYTRFWCMLELDLALHAHALAAGLGAGQERRQPAVLPVFYDDPTTVMSASGFEEDPERPVVQWWSTQLGTLLQQEKGLGREWARWVDPGHWAANLAAMKNQFQNLRRSVYAAHKDQDKLLANQVAAAAVRAMPRQVHVEPGLVGVEQQLEQLLRELPNWQGLWLHGPGGTGKSTMAKTLLNNMSAGFSHTALVEILVGDGPAQIGQHLASVLKGLGATVNGSEPPAELVQRLKDWVKDGKVLYVLDNVWTTGQLDTLLPAEWGTGSVVIITSRYLEMTSTVAWQAVHKQLYSHKMALLHKPRARKLFQEAAGLESTPTRLQDLEESILQVCGGLPLALRVAGGALYGQTDNERQWKGILDGLKQGTAANDSEGRLKAVVTVSLQHLEHPHVSMFLDVATVLRGQPQGMCEAVGCAWWGPRAAAYFATLRKASLVEVDEGGRLAMHDVLVALGRALVLDGNAGFEKYCGSRVWMDGEELVGYNQAIERGVKVAVAQLTTLPYLENKYQDLSACPGRLQAAGVFKRLDLSGARILWLGDVVVPPHDQVLWLSVACFDRANFWLQKKAPQPKLVVLQAYSHSKMHILRCIKAWMKAALAGQLPAAVAACTSLHTLVFRDCISLTSLPNTSLQLSALQSLDLSWCRQLAGLPEFFGQLSALQSLDLSQCEQLASLPESLGRLSALQSLSLRGCRFAGLPESFGQLSALQSLNLSQCWQLAALPESFGRLPALQSLDLSRCKQLAGLPESFGQLAALQSLDLSECVQLAGLPESFGQLSAMQSLNLFKCEQLAGLPESFGQLSAMQSLVLRWCWHLAGLPESFGQLSALQSLNLGPCARLAGLPESFGQLSAMQSLSLGRCEQLAALPASFGQLSALQSLGLYACAKLAGLPESFGQLSALQSLGLSMCEQLAGLPESFGKLSALQSLNLQGCKHLAGLPESFGQLSALQFLHLRECVQLAGLPESFGQLLALQSLDLSGCQQLAGLPESFGQLSALQFLDLRECVQLAGLPESFGQLLALQSLDLSVCQQLAGLPESFGQLSALQALKLRSCEQLAGQPESFGQLSALRRLNLSGCKQLAGLPESIGQLPALQFLKSGGARSVLARQNPLRSCQPCTF